jgi:hypothetical protein
VVNLSLDLLNRIVESKIEIYDEINYNSEDSIREEFLNRYKYDADSKLVSLIIDNQNVVYKYIHNELKIQYKLHFLKKCQFVIEKKESITLEFEYYSLNEEEQSILNKVTNEVDRVILGNTNFSYYILYLLKFKNGTHYKLGITNQLELNRIKHLDDLYDIDFENSVIYYGLKRDIQLVETYLKKLIPEIYNNPYKSKDGFSEIREIKSFDKVIDKCDNQFSKDFYFIRLELKNLEDGWKQKIKKTKPVKSNHEKIDLPDFEDILDIDFDF